MPDGEGLLALDMLPLASNRAIKDLVFFYKVFYGYINIDITTTQWLFVRDLNIDLYYLLFMYESFTNPTRHSFVTLSSTTKLGLGLPNKVMSTCVLSKLELEES